MTTLSRRSFLKITAVTGVALAAPALANKVMHESVVLTETRWLMGTLVHFSVVTSDEEYGKDALSATLGEMERLIAIYDHRRPSSPLAQLNQAGRIEAAPIELTSLVSDALNYSDLSRGAFDITVKPMLDAYQAGRAPGKAECELVGYQNVQIDGKCIAFRQPGMAVTLDGIAKGRIVDGAVSVLRARGFNNVLVEAGGDLVASGQNPDHERWEIGIAHPRPERLAGYIAKFALRDRAVATSGDYLNAFSADMKLNHIIDPRTGVSPTTLASVTVVAPDATTADVLSTTLMVMLPNDGLALVGSLANVEALIVTKELTIRRTAGFPT